MVYKDLEKKRVMRKAFYQRHKERLKEESRVVGKKRTAKQNYLYRIKSKYGLAPEDYDSMLVRQDFRCAICKEDGKNLCVDHDHDTGLVRGLLCASCNNGLGRFKDEPSYLLNAYEYLTRGM